MAHPGVVRNGEREVLPIHRFEVAEDAIDNPEGGFQVRFSLVVLGAHDGASVGDGFEYRLVGLVPDALTLDRKVEKWG